MKVRIAVLTGMLAVAASLSACAVDEAYYGPPGAPYADVDYDAYYDGFYGAFYGGYWGPGDRFYYWNQDHRHYHVDNGAHFRRSGGAGFNAVRGHAPAAVGRGGAGNRRP